MNRAADPRIGTSIEGKYRLEAQIGVGGMATVYRATRLMIGDAVAVKILHAEQLREPQAAERFRREAQAAARLKHPNAVTIYDFGISDDGVVYLVMELVEGKSLRAVLQEQGPLFASGVAAILAQVCGALNDAHEQHVVHRDIKPDNILVTETPSGVRVKVLDFGIARISDMSNLGNLTQTGSVMGTPHYMSPEQCLGEELDGRSDIYSVGIVAYQMLTGVVPFNSPTAMAVAVSHVNTPPAPLRVLNSSVPPAVETVVMRALEKRRDARPQTAAAFAAEFSAAVAGTAAPAGRAAEASASLTPAMMPTVQMQTPWSSGSALPPGQLTPGSPAATYRSEPARKPVSRVLIGGLAAVVVAGMGLGSYLMTREAPASTAPVDPVVTHAAAPPPEDQIEAPPEARVTAPSPVNGAAPAAAVVRGPLQPPVQEAAEPRDREPQVSGASETSATRGEIALRVPPGSTVQLDGFDAGTAGAQGTLVLSGLRAGRHHLVVRKDRYQDVERTISVVAGQRDAVEITLVPVADATMTPAPASAARSEGDKPQIAELAADRLEVAAGQGATLRVSASDANSDTLKYVWSTTAGRIDGRGTVASFRPPAASEQARTATVSVIARNSRGLEARKDIVITLKPAAPAASPVAPGGIRRRAYAVGTNTEVWLESAAGASAPDSGVVEADLTMVENVWQIGSVRGNFPGQPITITLECRNCELAGIAEHPNAANGFRRVRVRVKPVDPQQPMGVLLRYQINAPARKK